MDTATEICLLKEEVRNLRNSMSGTICETGSYSHSERTWNINYSSILTRLIQETGRWCENYASDLFIWWSAIDEKLNDGTIETDSFVFAMHKSGVDSRKEYEYNSVKKYYSYSKVWFLDVTIEDGKIEMVLHK